MENTRELVLDMLMEILEKNSYSHLVIRGVLDKYNYSDTRDKAFIKRVTEGTLERLIQIDYILDQFSKVPVLKMKPLIRNLLRMSVYQLLFMDGIPDSAVCNEAVKLAGKRGFRGLSGFVNGILRSIARKKTEVCWPDKDREPVRYLSVCYSMPEWIVEMWRSAYGEEKTEKILAGLLEEHPVSVRLSGRLSGTEKNTWMKELEEEGVEIQAHPYLSYAFWLRETEGVQNLPGYEAGYFAVQDVSSMLVTEAAVMGLEAESGVLALDVCAAPGGKSVHLAERLAGRGKVIAGDLSENKVTLIRDNSRRMRCDNLETVQQDARCLDESLIGQADILLADLPCSGLGILGKKRDIKYRASKEGLRELAALQKQILSVVWQYVKPGGVMIYSTCTVHREENEEMIRWFTESYPFETESLEACLPEELKKEGESGMLQLLPGIHETDGFFLARLRRTVKGQTHA